MINSIRKETEFVKQKNSLDEKKDDCLKTDSSISHLIAERDASSKAISDAEINVKKYNHKIQSFHQTKAKAIKIVSDLKKQHEWIEKEEQYVYEFNITSDNQVFPKNKLFYSVLFSYFEDFLEENMVNMILQRNLLLLLWNN
jgi:hypothetical protein